MTPKGKERLLKLAEILDVADAQHRKKKEPTYVQNATIHDCGTPACALGHWAAANKRRFKYDRRSGIVALLDDPENIAVSVIGAREFDLSMGQAVELFSGWGCGEARTAKQAARYIRTFVKRVERVENNEIDIPEAA